MALPPFLTKACLASIILQQLAAVDLTHLGVWPAEEMDGQEEAEAAHRAEQSPRLLHTTHRKPFRASKLRANGTANLSPTDPDAYYNMLAAQVRA